MPKSYSADLRKRVIEAVASGVSRHEAAELFGIAVSTAVKWWQHWRETGSTAPKPRGGSKSRLEEHRISILRLVKEQPDSTFEELLPAVRKRRIRSSRSALWRVFESDINSLQKKTAGRRTARGRSRCCIAAAGAASKDYSCAP